MPTSSTLILLAALALLTSDVLLIGLGYYARELSRSAAVTPRAAVGVQPPGAPWSEALTGLDKRLARLDARLDHMEERDRQRGAVEPSTQALEVAAKLVQRGADVGEVMSLCGLTRGEADLVRILYGPEQATSAHGKDGSS